MRKLNFLFKFLDVSATTTTKSDNVIKKMFSESITETIKTTVRRCCTERCHLSQLERLCCRRPNCLRRCYGPNFFSIASRSKIKSPYIKTSGLRQNFRFLNLLTKTNPIRRRHNPTLVDSEDI